MENEELVEISELQKNIEGLLRLELELDEVATNRLFDILDNVNNGYINTEYVPKILMKILFSIYNSMVSVKNHRNVEYPEPLFIATSRMAAYISDILK